MCQPTIAWVTDSTSSLSADFIDKHNIHVVPLSVVINGASYKETIDISEEELYIRMQKEEGVYQTSQPSVGDFIALYEKLQEQYEFGIAIHASSHLSGTYNTSVMAAELVGFPLYGIDSLTGSFALGQMIAKGIELEKQGLLIEEIVLQLNQYKQQSRLFLVPANLEQLHKSGRVSGSQKLVASLLGIRPILAIEEGKATIKEKVRSQKKAFSWMIQQLKNDLSNHLVKKVAILHANDDKKANELAMMVQQEIPNMEVEKLMLISVAGVHTGAQTVGISWIVE